MTIQLKGYEPAGWSFSRYSSYLRCGKAYELEKLVKAPRLPAWYSIGGTVVHEETESYDRLCLLQGELVTVEADLLTKRVHAKLDELVAEEVEKTGVDPAKWQALGRGEAGKQRGEFWRDQAVAMVQRWIDWRAETNWQWAEFKGEPGVELRLEIELGGLPFTAILDRLPIMPNEDLAVVDVKTGTKTNALQLGTYATAVQAAGLPRPKWGMFWMAKTGKHTPPIPLDMYTKDYLDQIFGEAAEGVRRGVFPPSVGEACRMCSVADACYSNDGAVSHLYDRLDPSYGQDAVLS